MVRQMQIEATRDIAWHLSEWLPSINPQMTSAGEAGEEMEPSCTVGGDADWCNHCGKQYRVSLKKLEMHLPYYSEIPLLGIYSKKPQTLIQKNICTHVISLGVINRTV